MSMRVTCYGPRGSLPSPSTETFKTSKYGGNTSCYYVEAGLFRLILDCGSGIRQLGNDLLARKEAFGGDWIVLLSHYHWDHIQGLPFCVPMFIGANRFQFHGFTPSGHERGPKPVVESMLGHQQSNPHFPVAHTELPAKRFYTDHSRQFSETFYAHMTTSGYRNDDGSVRKVLVTTPLKPSENTEYIKITTIPLNHPDGCLGFRIEHHPGKDKPVKTLVYATDNEPLRHTNAQLNKHGKGADLIILDGQYSEEQLAGPNQIFGHGTPKACIEQAVACEAKKLLVHHHDPNHDDNKIKSMELHALRDAIGTSLEGKVEFAREGKVYEL